MKNYTPLTIPPRPSQQKRLRLKTGKEAEPISTPEKEPIETKEVHIEERVELQPAPELAKTLEARPEEVAVSEELQKHGVEPTKHTTIFVHHKKVELPMAIEDVDKNLHKPLTVGSRWIAEITKYILAKLHVVIKKVGGVFQVVEKT